MGIIGALRGGVAFFTRLPVGFQDGDWEALRSRPVVVPVVGIVAGAIAAIPFLGSETLSGPTVAFAYVLFVYAVMGIHHLDGVADLGDALVVHGDVERRRAVLQDTTTGVGALLAVSLVISGLALGGLALASLPLAVAAGIAIAAEAGAKLGMALMACFGTAQHDGMGAQFTTRLTPRAAVAPLAITVPIAFLTWPHPAAAAALLGAVGALCFPWYVAHRHLGGINGDVFGAANEIGRVVGLHMGVIVWTLW